MDYMFVLLALLCALGVTHAQLQVNTTEGLIEGTIIPDGNYHAFYGIPYAGATDGDNRFKAPRPPSPYPGMFHAINKEILCVHPTTRGLVGIENCLTLSIFTNNITTTKPVLVLLNAEEYTKTPDNYYQFSYKKLVEEGIVVVPLNFRLSVFGFLCLGVPEAPGNAGIRDVIQGLQWIKNNIAGFGGNPGNVTLMGHGSAAAIVDLITMAPQAENLVHKAIALSGSALAPWAVAYDPISHAEILGARLSYTGKSSSELAKLLASTDINLFGVALRGSKFFNNTPLFAPCIEDTKLNPNDSVLADAPISLLRNGKYSHIPYITSYVTEEGTLRAEQAVTEQWLEKMHANFTEFLPVDLDFGTNTLNKGLEIQNFYFAGSEINMATVKDYLAYQGDTLVRVSVIRAARERALSSRSEVRLMEFGYKRASNSWPYHQIPLDGVEHGGILSFIFDFDLGTADASPAQSLIKRFSHFAYTGLPTPTGFAVWEPISNQTLHYLLCTGQANLSGISSYQESTLFNPHSIKMTFWNQLYTESYKAPVAISSANRLVNLVFISAFSFIFVRCFSNKL